MKRKISETLNVSLKEALDLFYKSETCRRLLARNASCHVGSSVSVWRAFPPGAIMDSTVMPIGGKNCGMVCVLSVGREELL